MENLLNYVNNQTGSEGTWRHIPDEAVSNLRTLYNVFLTAFSNTLGPHTPAQTLAKNETQAETAKALRPFVNQYLRFAPVTNVDRLEMGVPNHDTIRTDHTVVTEKVDFVIHLRGIRELSVDFWVQGSSNKAKPYGYDGAVLVWDITDTPPQKPEDLHHHTMASRTPTVIHFEETDRGKTAYIALVWQNERGITGQWSEFKSAVIP